MCCVARFKFKETKLKKMCFIDTWCICNLNSLEKNNFWMWNQSRVINSMRMKGNLLVRCTQYNNIMFSVHVHASCYTMWNFVSKTNLKDYILFKKRLIYLYEYQEGLYVVRIYDTWTCYMLFLIYFKIETISRKQSNRL